MSNIQSTYYGAKDEKYRMSSTRRDRVMSLLDHAITKCKKEQCSILDIGIGSGEVAQHCRNRWQDRQLYLEGIDVSSLLIERHRSMYDAVRVLNVDDAGWERKLGRRYDVIIASELLEHLFRPDLFLQQLPQILPPDGVVIITTPNLLLWSKRIKFLFGFHEYAESGVLEWGHIHLFSWRYLKKILQRSGFEIVESHHLLHPNTLNRWHHFLPGLLAFQFILTVRKKEKVSTKVASQ